jgi:hypothetical protein
MADFVAEGGDYEQPPTWDDLVAMTCHPTHWSGVTSFY